MRASSFATALRLNAHDRALCLGARSHPPPRHPWSPAASALAIARRLRAPYEIALANQLVMLVGWVIAVPTTMANAPASMAALASSSVWMRPSQNTGTP